MSDAASLNQQNEAKETCDALCELSAGAADQKETKTTKKATKYCPKQLQLPMFLSSK